MNGKVFITWMNGFWKHMEEDLGVSKEGIDSRVNTFSGFIVGQKHWVDHTTMLEKGQGKGKAEDSSLDEIELCEDIELTFAIISRLAGNLFLPRRPGNYEEKHLLNSVFVTDDPRIP